MRKSIRFIDFAIAKGAALLKPAYKTDYGGYAGYFADPDGIPGRVVVAPNIEVGAGQARSLAGLVSMFDAFFFARTGVHPGSSPGQTFASKKLCRRLNSGNCDEFQLRCGLRSARSRMIRDKSEKNPDKLPKGVICDSAAEFSPRARVDQTRRLAGGRLR